MDRGNGRDGEAKGHGGGQVVGVEVETKDFLLNAAHNGTPFPEFGVPQFPIMDMARILVT